MIRVFPSFEFLLLARLITIGRKVISVHHGNDSGTTWDASGRSLNLVLVSLCAERGHR